MAILFNNQRITTWIILTVVVLSLSMAANADTILTNIDIQWRNDGTEFREVHTMSQYRETVRLKTAHKFTAQRMWCEVGPWTKQTGPVTITYGNPTKITMGASNQQSTNKERKKAEPRTKEAQRAATHRDSEKGTIDSLTTGGTYIPATRSESSTEETQSSSITQPVSGSNKKQRGSYNTISEGPDSQMSYGNNDEAKRLEDQRGRDEGYAQEIKNQQDREIRNRAFQLENRIRCPQYYPDYQGMATEASFLSKDAYRAGNSGAAHRFDDAASKLNQMSRDADSLSPKSTFLQQDRDNNRKSAADSVWQGGSSIEH